ncbi:hypothetical protein K469DRAFT_702197 [Zopfia rhizophila CBS 207.26]|uniref:Uncharacterized protein n=1 Tax=Zopfia rhizophila CBS 207.26 TaxID=1314779 RepID=A0A6A6DBW1_9PEZI|nr:hypothetical protein K469DRAFT_702197 [Zopfia rhizophila CBS 207.26]
MSRPPTRGTGDASGPREVQQLNHHEPPSRPTRNAPRIFTDGTIPYSINGRSITQALDDVEATEDTRDTISITPQTPTGTNHNPPQRKTRKLPKMNMLQTQASTAAPIAAQLRQGRIDQTKGLQEAVNKIITAIKEQEELAEKRHSELRAELQEIRAQNEHLKQELRECKEELQAYKNTLLSGANNRPTYAAAAARSGGSPQLNHQSPSSSNYPSDTLLSLPGFDLDMTEAYGMHMENANVKNIRERIQQAFKSHEPTQDIGWVGIIRQGGNLVRVRVYPRTHKDERKARIYTDWINSHFRGARIHSE